MSISVGWLLILVIYFWLLRRFIFTFVHIGSNSVQHMKVYFSRPDILWKIRFLAVVCNIFNTQVFIPRNWRGNILIAVKNSISQRQPFIPGNRWKRHLSYNRQIGTYMVICKERLFGKRPWYVFLGLTVAEGDLRLLPVYAAGYVRHHNLYAIPVPWYLGKGGQVHQDTEAWKYLSMCTRILIWISQTCSSCS